MSDDIVKRLLMSCGPATERAAKLAAAAHIERIEAENARLTAELAAEWERRSEYAIQCGRLDVKLTKLREALADATASLVAAVSLLECGGKTAAASDKMFEQMLVDYQASITRARAVLRETKGDGGE